MLEVREAARPHDDAAGKRPIVQQGFSCRERKQRKLTASSVRQDARSSVPAKPVTSRSKLEFCALLVAREFHRVLPGRTCERLCTRRRSARNCHSRHCARGSHHDNRTIYAARAPNEATTTHALDKSHRWMLTVAHHCVDEAKARTTSAYASPVFGAAVTASTVHPPACCSTISTSFTRASSTCAVRMKRDTSP